MEMKEQEIKDKIMEVHKMLVMGLCNPLFTHTSKECNFRLRADLFACAMHCVMDLVWENDRFETDLKNMKQLIDEHSRNE